MNERLMFIFVNVNHGAAAVDTSMFGDLKNMLSSKNWIHRSEVHAQHFRQFTDSTVTVLMHIWENLIQGSDVCCLQPLGP